MQLQCIVDRSHFEYSTRRRRTAELDEWYVSYQAGCLRGAVRADKSDLIPRCEQLCVELSGSNTANICFRSCGDSTSTSSLLPVLLQVCEVGAPEGGVLQRLQGLKPSMHMVDAGASVKLAVIRAKSPERNH